MINVSTKQDIKRLRRIAIAAQKLNRTTCFATGLRGVAQAVEHLGYVQLDTISVVERAHHHVMFSRVKNYKVDMLNQLLQTRDIFEYWSHAAAYLPIEGFRFSLPYKYAIKSGQTHWHKTKDTALMTELLSRIKADGPLCSRDIESHKNSRSGWWDWKPAKKALEQLFMEGDIMVCDRTGFQKTYDLSENVLPSHIDTRMPSVEEFAAHMLDSQLRCHGLVSKAGITYLRRNAGLKQAVSTLIETRLAQQELEAVMLNDAVYYLPFGAFEQSTPRLGNRLTILSPFDNLVIQRGRLKDLFTFDYQIECYVPEHKRKYGYFSLPLLYNDSFVGRMDCKAHRKTKVLEVKSLHFSDESVLNKSLFSGANTMPNENVMQAFVKALIAFKNFQQCDQIKFGALISVELSTQIKAHLVT